jgi:hypothetical protein
VIGIDVRADDLTKYFALNNLAIESRIRDIEAQFSVDLGHKSKTQRIIDQSYYPQFSQRHRSEATEMAIHYAVFYCLENHIRELIKDRLADIDPINWWSTLVPENVRKNAESNQKRETSTGITPRSAETIDFTNFGELGEIIKANWTVFGDTFRDQRAVEKVLANLNTLRAPIAHCKPLAEDEIVRLHLSLRDWFRQME